MKLAAPHWLRHLLRSEQAQALPVITLMLISLLGMGGIVIDIGHAYFSFRELQSSTDAAALAGAKALPSSTAIATATQYSGVAGAYNAQPNLPNVTMATGYPKVSCLTTLKNQGMACISPGNGNAVSVRQTVNLPMYFLTVVGKKTMTLTATSTSSMRGGTPTPYNIAIVADQTLSMNIYDDDCGDSQNNCALTGIRNLLQSLTPCAINLTTCTFTGGVAANSVDRVAIFGFPAMSVGTVGIDTSCTQPVPAPTSSNGYYSASPYGNFTVPYTPWNNITTLVPYSYPTAGASSYSPGTTSTNPTYQITNFNSDYRASNNTQSLNQSSTLVMAAGGKTNCYGMQPGNYGVLFATYYAAAIYAAQSALVAQAAANPGSQNVMIILSDGDANAPQNVQYNGTTYWVMPSPASNSGKYPSYVGECGQGIVAADAATAAGTHVYSVAYGSPTVGCSTDKNAGDYPNITPCLAMSNMASAPQYFFSDYKQSNANDNGNAACYSTSQQVTSLSEIFKQIASDLTVGRLIPDNTP